MKKKHLFVLDKTTFVLRINYWWQIFELNVMKMDTKWNPQNLAAFIYKAKKCLIFLNIIIKLILSGRNFEQAEKDYNDHLGKTSCLISKLFYLPIWFVMFLKWYVETIYNAFIAFSVELSTFICTRFFSFSKKIFYFHWKKAGDITTFGEWYCRENQFTKWYLPRTHADQYRKLLWIMLLCQSISQIFMDNTTNFVWPYRKLLWTILQTLSGHIANFYGQYRKLLWTTPQTLSGPTATMGSYFLLGGKALVAGPLKFFF